jgi:hypothetical protein
MVKINFEYAGTHVAGTRCSKEEIERHMNDLFQLEVSPDQRRELCIQERSKELTDILYGSKKIRLGRAPTEEEREFMIDRVSQWVESGHPLEIISLWGATKGYGIFGDRLGVDLSDILGIRRFMKLDTDVRSIYSPGTDITIIREDLGEVALSGNQPELGNKILRYTTELDRLTKVLGVSDHIKFLDESALLKGKGLSPEEFLLKGQENARKFFSYWVASSNVSEDERDKLPEYKELTRIDWRGTIPDVMREHYLDRVGTEHPTASIEEKVEFVCTYLGTALARYHTRLFGGTFKTPGGVVIPPIKASFVPYPPGTPESLKKGRVEYKLKESKTSNNTVPPWASFGFVIPNGDNGLKLSVSSVGQMRNINPRDIVPGSIDINTERGYQTCRADVLEKLAA